LTKIILFELDDRQSVNHDGQILLI
jgi:hypothetical protein